MAKILILQPIAREGIQSLLDRGFSVHQLDNPGWPTLAREIVDTDGLLVRDAAVSGELIEMARQLKVISRHGVGLEKIDLKKATERAVWVTYTPTANSISVAEHVIGMIVALAKNLMITDQLLRQGNFGVGPELYGVELQGKTLCLLGLGNVGRVLAKKAAYGLGMNVVGYDPFVDHSSLDPMIQVTLDWAGLFREADFLSVHIPLNDQTRGLIGKKEFRLMKNSAFFINCARGPIVKEVELVEALRDGLIAGASLDVYDPSPPGKDHALCSMNNVIMTPHTAACTREAMIKMAIQAAQGIIEVLTGKDPTWPANRIKKRSGI